MTSSAVSTASGGRGWTITFWVVQVLLAAMFGLAGFMKGFTPMPQLGEMMVWVRDVPVWLTRFIGFSELAGAIGLILPAATRIKPALTGWAGVGLAIVMVNASGFHVMRGEYPNVPMVAVLGALAAFVAWGRLRKAPIAPR